MYIFPPDLGKDEDTESGQGASLPQSPDNKAQSPIAEGLGPVRNLFGLVVCFYLFVFFINSYFYLYIHYIKI